MSDYINLEPDELRRTAADEDRLAGKIRAWGQIPDGWLKEFPDGYGTIAHPVHKALTEYYNRRHEKAERLADTHEKTRDELLAAAQRMEDSDLGSGEQVRRSDDGYSPSTAHSPTVPPAFIPPTRPAPSAPVVNDSPPGRPPTVPQPTKAHSFTPDSHPGPVAPTTSPPGGDRIPGGPISAQTGMQPSSTTYSAFTPPRTQSGSPTPPAGAVSAPMTNGAAFARGPGTDMPVPASISGTTVDSSTASPSYAPTVAAHPGGQATMPRPIPTGLFSAARTVAAERRAFPLFVVGESPDDDLALARTLLAAVLAAVQHSTSGAEWAASVIRTPIGAVTLLTSTEGRGWLPAGLYLPGEIIHPWRWKNMALDRAGRAAIDSFEGTADPARILAEFGILAARRSRGHTSALVSSTDIDEGLRTALGNDVATERFVTASEAAVDLSTPGPGLLDRLAVAGSDAMRERASHDFAHDVRSGCLELARMADAQVQRAIASGGSTEIPDKRAWRARILHALEIGHAVPDEWLDQIAPAIHRAAAPSAHHVDLSHIPLGTAVPPFAIAPESRSAFFERRADELLLLAARVVDGQDLRDAYYVYDQITGHPHFPSAPASQTISAAAAVARPPAPALPGALATFGMPDEQRIVR